MKFDNTSFFYHIRHGNANITQYLPQNSEEKQYMEKKERQEQQMQLRKNKQINYFKIIIWEKDN